MGLRASFKHALHRWQGYRGNLDGIVDGVLVGWAAALDPRAAPVHVGVFSGKGLLAETTANMFRGDLLEAGIGSGHHGFALPLDEPLLRAVERQGGRITVKVLGGRGFEVGSWQLGGGRQRSRLGLGSQAAVSVSMSDQLLGALTRLAGLRDQLASGRSPPEVAPRLERHGLMFSPQNIIPNEGISTSFLPPQMTAYGDYVRYRYRLDQEFPLDDRADPTLVEAEHYLQWYLAGYSTLRGGLRVPLSAGQIEYLNAPLVIGGQRRSLSRATWMFLAGMPTLRERMDFANEAWIDQVVYWWAIQQAYAMHVEDCLVPAGYIERLSRIPDEYSGQSFAPTVFLVHLARNVSAFSQFDLSSEADRRNLLLGALALSVQRPDYLRYISSESCAAALAVDAEQNVSLLGAFLAQHAAGQEHASDFSTLTPTEFSAVQRLNGFDCDTRRFLCFTSEGHRVEAAMLPAPQGEMVDVQLIGPFQKASGLGQAARLSAAVLEHAVKNGANLSLNAVDFDLDNPAPEGFSRVGALSNYRRAKINLLHLNGESVPLSFAYQPDVLSGAYNIGYFFWELDTPAACHHLGMELLDEIWVSTRYGVEIYRPHSEKPVTNVGMCFEQLPTIDVEDARTFLRSRCGIGDREFVFLAAFDSFSFIQRKNPLGTIRAFREAFPVEPDVRLVIKTQNRRRVTDTVQVRIWEELDREIESDPRIQVIDETLSYDDLLRLKCGADAYVSLHRSEGWGFGMIEAMNLKVPVLATGYSGNMEFCSEETAFLVGYEEVELLPEDYIFIRPGQKWAEPDIADAVRQMRSLRQDEDLRARRVQAAWRHVQQNFSEAAISTRYMTRINEILAGGAR